MLPNKTLENAIVVYKTTMEACMESGDPDYISSLDKATIEFLEELKKYREIGTLEEISAFLEENEKLKNENRALKNWCFIFTQGAMCLFCPIDCDDRKEKFRGGNK